MIVLVAASAALAAVLAAQVWVVVKASRAARILWTWQRGATTYVVRDHRGWRELVADDGARAMVHTRIKSSDPLMSGARYTDGFHLSVALAGPPRRVLFIGGGGAVGPRQFAAFYPEAEVDVVEIDAQILCAARRFFGLKDDRRLHAHVGDGRSFIAAAPDDWFDVVVLDAYAGAGYLVQPLASDAFLRTVRHKLRPGGVLCANLVGAAGHPDSPVRGVASAIAFAFDGQCRTFSVPGGRDNCIAVAVRSSPAYGWDDLPRRLGTVDPRVRRFAAAIARRPLRI